MIYYPHRAARKLLLCKLSLSPPHRARAVENHFHVFDHTAKENVQEFKSHPAMLFAMLASFPLLSMLGLLLVIPLGPYCADHAAFQNLNVIRPDHHVRLMVKVYRAWTQANGKLAGKDL